MSLSKMYKENSTGVTLCSNDSCCPKISHPDERGNRILTDDHGGKVVLTHEEFLALVFYARDLGLTITL